MNTLANLARSRRLMTDLETRGFCTESTAGMHVARSMEEQEEVSDKDVEKVDEASELEELEDREEEREKGEGMRDTGGTVLEVVNVSLVGVGETMGTLRRVDSIAKSSSSSSSSASITSWANVFCGVTVIWGTPESHGFLTSSCHTTVVCAPT
jgi:hypothetical protein